MELSKWLHDDEWLDSLHPEALSERAKKAVSQLRFTFNEKEIEKLIQEVVDGLLQIDRQCKMVSLRAFYEPGNHEINENYDRLSDYQLLYLSSFSEFFQSVSDSTRGSRVLSSVFPSLPQDFPRLAGAYNPDLLPLLRKERQLVSEFQSRLEEISLSGTRPAVVKGEVRQLLQSLSRDHRMRAYLSLTGRIRAYRNEMEKLFLSLHELRRNIGQKAGFSTYHDFLLAKNGIDEKSRADVHRFRHLVEKHIAPLSDVIRQAQWERIKVYDPAPWDALYLSPSGVPTLAEEAFPLEGTYLKALRYIFSSKVPLFDAMNRKGALSFHVTGSVGQIDRVHNICSHDAMAGINSAFFPEIGQSFLLLSSVPQEWLCRILFSETGSLLYDQSAQKQNSISLSLLDSGLLRQLARYSMVILSQRAWGLFYNQLTRYAKEYDLIEWALDLPLYCALDEMEEFICRARVSNLAVFRHAWSEIATRYRLEGTSPDKPGLIPVDDLWLFSPLWWTQPLSGIEQALAQVMVLGSLPYGRYHQRLEECFTRLLLEDEPKTPFALIEDAGYPSPFAEETVQKAAFSIVDFLGL